jgi:predicted RNase H-like nuclease
LPKIREIDELLQTHPELRSVVREVHPEVSFYELVGAPLAHGKHEPEGREERRRALTPVFPRLEAIMKAARAQGLPTEDILDALSALWSALRLADGRGRSLPTNIPLDSTGLPMAIWV